MTDAYNEHPLYDSLQKGGGIIMMNITFGGLPVERNTFIFYSGPELKMCVY